MTPVMTLEAAVQYALENNPQLAALRRQHGIAAAGVVIARTYPFNPIAQSAVQHARGPNVTNSVPSQHQVTLELEILGQRHFRKQAAFAALTRTDWEIAFQEVTFAVNAVRAFDSLLYRQAKLGVVEEFLRLNEKATEQVGQLVERGTLRPPDLILARTEVNTVRTQIGLSQTAVESAKRELARALGMYAIDMPLQGTLERAVPGADEDHLLDAALEHRPDLFARRSAVTEAEARVQLQLADRFGNPKVGPAYQVNETKVEFIGGQVSVPLPLFNRRQGEVQQLKEQQAQAMLYLRQTEVEVRQDVHAAFTRLVTARTWVDNYRKQVLPDLRKSLEDMDRLFRQGQAGVDVLRVLDVRRALLRAQDGYMDALQIYTQALADLAQAVGDPTLAVGCYQQSEELPAPKPVPEAMPPK
jgi:cobalt-zinc-cadmium efflux system outer membrane protein